MIVIGLECLGPLLTIQYSDFSNFIKTLKNIYRPPPAVALFAVFQKSLTFVSLLIQVEQEGTASPLFCYRYFFMEFGEKIRVLAESFLKEGQFLVHLSVSSLTGPQKVTISLDADQGVTIDDCAELSRSLTGVMEEQGLIGDNFTLEVSTPGVDKPLVLKRQYARNAGRRLKIYLKDKSKVEGKLSEVREDSITLEVETGEGKKKEVNALTIGFDDIEKAVVQVSFK